MVTIQIPLQERVCNVQIHVQHVIIKNVLLAKQILISMMEVAIILAHLRHNSYMVFTVGIA